MKVICIDGMSPGQNVFNGFGQPTSPLRKDEEIYTGEIYIVIGEFKNARGENYYRLEGKPTDIVYHEKRFSPISSIDETEFERNYNKELV